MKDSCYLELLPRKAWSWRAEPDEILIGRKWNKKPTVPLAPGAKLLKIEVEVDPSYFLDPTVRVQIGQTVNHAAVLA